MSDLDRCVICESGHVSEGDTQDVIAGHRAHVSGSSKGLVVRFRDRREYGDRIETRVFVGPDEDRLQLAGTLHLDVGEWHIIGAALLAGARFFGSDHLVVQTPDDMLIVDGSA